MVETLYSLPCPSPPPTLADTDMSQLRLWNSPQSWSATSTLTAKKKNNKMTMDEFEKVKHQTVSTGRLQISKMKELVSATAVSFRHARALVFSFGATFLLLVSWKMSDDELVPLRCTNYHFLAGGVHFFFKLLALCCCHFSFFLRWCWAMCSMISVPFVYDPFESTRQTHFFFLLPRLVLLPSRACPLCTSPIFSSLPPLNFHS